MLLGSDDLNFEIQTILKLTWDKQNGKMSGVRNFHALSYRFRGESKLIHNDDEYIAKKGEIAFVPQNFQYKQICTQEELIVIHFTSNQQLPEKIKVFSVENKNYFEKQFNDLYDIWTKKQVGYKYRCKSVIYKILSKLEREFSETKLLNTHDKILDAVEYIHDNFTDNSLCITDLSKMCNMSDTYFRKLFFELFKTTPIDYIKKLKLNYAKELLKSGYYTVEETAYKCGFTTVNYFSAFIKKETGLSPSAFKCENSLPTEIL